MVRMRTKMTNPYAYFQERENRMFKAYEMMAIYKTMHQIETELAEAKNYLCAANEFYDKQGGRNSPTQQDYNYLKRMVDDGEPVVLSKSLAKTLKIKDDQS